MRTYKRILLAALAAAAIAAGATTQESRLAGDPSQWGAAKRGSFDITEELLTSQEDDKNGDVPVVPGLAGSDPRAFGRESA